jgi:WD40-like Beta Propeller Repeat./Immunoglobulin I-set domain.
MHAFLRPALVLLLVFLAPLLRAQSPTWTSLNHGLGSNLNELNSVAFGNGLFVAIKSTMSGGTLHYATSTDGTTWTARTLTTSITSSGSAQRVRFLDGKFLIMPIGLDGANGVALAFTSTDGLNWTSSTVGTTATSPDEIDFGGGRVLAVGGNNYFIGSSDFSTWTGLNTGLQGAFGIQDVAYGNGRWFITTNGGGEVATSTDGVTFTKVDGLGVLGGFRVEYGNGVWFFYSQVDNAVSSDGVTFTTVTRTPNVTPGGTGNIRFVNGRFLSYGPGNFQASTDGQTWTDFGTPPSLGAGFVFHAINDFAYGNGKYVAVGSRDFPATAALIFTSDGTSGGDGGDHTPSAGDFTLALQVGVTKIPGTDTVITGNLQGYALHDGGVVIAAPSSNTPLRTALLRHKNNQLTTLLSSSTGFPGDSAIHSMELASDGTRVFITPRTATNFEATRAALLKYENGSLTTLIADSDTVIADKEGFTYSSLVVQEAASNRVALIGGGGFATSYLYRYENNALTTVVAKGITPQPNGTGDGKFHRLEAAALSPDGNRLYFLANNGVNMTLPEFRRGIYVEENGAVSVVVDNTTTVPGTSTKFKFGEENHLLLSPDGSQVLFTGGNGDYDGTERHGIYRYANGVVTKVVDNTAVVGGNPLLTIMSGVVSNDGALLFYASGMNATGIYRAKDGEITLVQSGGVPGNFRSPTGLWLHGNYAYFKATNSSLQPILARVPVDGSTGATEVINFATHPDFAAIDTRDLEDLQFSGDLVLFNVGAVHNSIQRAALLYGPISLLDSSHTGGGDNDGGDNNNNNGGNDGGGNDGGGDNNGGGDSDPQPTLPSISAQPQSQTTATGGTVTFTVTASGTGLTYQWKHNGQAIAGATSATLTLTNIQSSHAGTYTVDITNSAGTVTSSSVTLTLLSPSTYGRLSALSIRAFVGQGDDILIAGFATGGGNGSLPLLIRGVGPTLANFGIPANQTLQDPELSIVRMGEFSATAANDNWSGDNDVLTASAALGAQPLAANNSADAAVYLTDLASGPYTAVVSGKNNGTGIALVEVYAGDDDDDAPRLLAISGRSTVGGGNEVLIAGFVVTQAPTRVLVRGAGPVLTSVPTRLADPRIALHRHGVVEPIATNDDWGTASNADELASLAAQVGAQPFANGSKDAALLVTLDPGVYTVVVSGADSSTGIALAEVYEVP